MHLVPELPYSVKEHPSIRGHFIFLELHLFMYIFRILFALILDTSIHKQSFYTVKNSTQLTLCDVVSYLLFHAKTRYH